MAITQAGNVGARVDWIQVSQAMYLKEPARHQEPGLTGACQTK
jgi:hypothetical protein